MDNIDSLDFEQAYAQLQDVLKRIESADLPLEESVAQYELGRRLAARCQALLDDAELRVRKLETQPGE